MSVHRPWMVSIPRTRLEGHEKITLVLQSPRRTPSFRRIIIPTTYAYALRVRSLKLGSVETGREILDTGPIPGAVLSENVDVETFDVPIEDGQSICLVVENTVDSVVHLEGVLLGLGVQAT